MGSNISIAQHEVISYTVQDKKMKARKELLIGRLLLEDEYKPDNKKTPKCRI